MPTNIARSNQSHSRSDPFPGDLGAAAADQPLSGRRFGSLEGHDTTLPAKNRGLESGVSLVLPPPPQQNGFPFGFDLTPAKQGVASKKGTPKCSYVICGRCTCRPPCPPVGSFKFSKKTSHEASSYFMFQGLPGIPCLGAGPMHKPLRSDSPAWSSRLKPKSNRSNAKPPITPGCPGIHLGFWEWMALRVKRSPHVQGLTCHRCPFLSDSTIGFWLPF